MLHIFFSSHSSLLLLFGFGTPQALHSATTTHFKPTKDQNLNSTQDIIPYSNRDGIKSFPKLERPYNLFTLVDQHQKRGELHLRGALLHLHRQKNYKEESQSLFMDNTIAIET